MRLEDSIFNQHPRQKIAILSVEVACLMRGNELLVSVVTNPAKIKQFILVKLSSILVHNGEWW